MQVRKLRQPSNFLLISLAVSDFFVGVFVMPLAYVYLITGSWTFGSALPPSLPLSFRSWAGVQGSRCVPSGRRRM